MSDRTIVAMPGDGIGKVVLDEAIRVLDKAGFNANYVEGDIGWEFWCSEGNPLPERTLELIAKHKIGLFGAITSKPKDEAFEELSPELQEKGLVYSSPIVGLRQHFGLDICLRPCRTYKGNPLNFIRRGPNNTVEEPEVDVAIFRQNTEGLYVGVEHFIPIDNDPKAVAEASGIITRSGCRRIAKFTFDYAIKTGRKKITIVHKANILKALTGLFLETAMEVGKEYKGKLEIEERIVDNTAMQLVINPSQFNIILTTNMFGDILSDEIAGLIGGLGLAPGGNIGENVAIFEAVHGTAPDIAGKGIANPTALFLASAMMLEYINEKNMADNLRNAIRKTLKNKKDRTTDLDGSATTKEYTSSVIANLK